MIVACSRSPAGRLPLDDMRVSGRRVPARPRAVWIDTGEGQVLLKDDVLPTVNPGPAIRDRLKRKPEPLIFLAYALVTAFMTWPAASLVSRTYAEPRDPLGGLWFFWWMRYSLHNRLPLSPMSFAGVPHGVPVNLYRTDPLNNLVMRLGTTILDETVSYNLVLLFSFLTAGVAFYYLVRHLTGNRPASAAAGLAFAFCPFMLAQGKEHLSLVLTAWIPVFVLLLVKAWRKRTWPSVCYCAASFVILALFNFQYGLIVGVYALAFIFTLYLSGRPWSGRRTRDGILWKAAAASALVAVAVALMLFSLSRSPAGSRVADPCAYYYSARPWDYLLPPAEGALLGFATNGFITSHLHGGFLVENTLFLGYVPLALAAYALASGLSGRQTPRAGGGGGGAAARDLDTPRERTAAPTAGLFPRKETGRLLLAFAAGGLASFVMSMPPSFNLGRLKIYLPSYITFKLLPQYRAYARFGVMVMFSVAALAGYGLAFLIERRRGRGAADSRPRGWLAAALLSCLVLLEFSLVPPFYSLDTKASADSWRWLKGRPGETVAAVYPMYSKDDFWNYWYLFQQRLHEKKLVNGAEPGTPADVYRQSLIDIYHPATPGLLKKLGTRYVVVIPSAFEQPVVHVDYPFPTRFDESALPPGLHPVARFPDGLIYEVTAPSARFMPTFSTGFYEPYVDRDGMCWHPALAESLVVVRSEAAGSVRCDLSLKIKSAGEGSTVRFELNGGEVLSRALSPRPVEVVLRGVSLNRGENHLVLRSDGAQAPLAEVPGYSMVVAAVLTGNVMVEEAR